MAELLPCPYLDARVELTDERFQHIASRHPEVLPGKHDWIATTLRRPRIVLRSARSPRARIFAVEYPHVRGEKFFVVIVATDRDVLRHWIVTSYIARDLPEGTPEWLPS